MSNRARHSRPLLPWLAVAVLAVGVLVGCGDDDDDAAPQVTAPDAASAAAQVDAAREAFCAATETHVEALDRYGRLFADSAITVGDVTNGGDDLVDSEADVLAAAEDYDTAVERAVAAAEREAAEAAEAAGTSSTTEPPTTTTFPPLASSEMIDAVREADATFNETMDDVDADTPLFEAVIEVTSAAYALQVAWLRLFTDAGCIEDPAGARAEVAAYVSALQTDLATAGFYTGAVDGIYGPETADAVRQLQAEAGLPATGLPDAATQRALNEVLAGQESASIAALQGVLAGLGYYSGPIDGIWSDDLEDALIAFQTEAGQEPSGVVTIETLIALQQLLAGATTTTTAPAAETTTTATAPPDETTTTTA